MKKRILTHLIVALVLMLIIALPALAIGNDTEAELTIEAANLSFEDSVYVLYAVSHEGIATDDVRMLFWTEAKDDISGYTIGTESYSEVATDMTATLNQKSCTVFKNDNLRAKNMADYVYARAYANVDGVEYYSEVSKYSILQYAYNMLGKTATASSNDELKAMLQSMLRYGADAQIYFNHNTERLADLDYYMICVESGTLEDGFTKGLYHSAEQATLTAPATKGELAFKGWADENGNIVSSFNPLTVTGFNKNQTYTAIYTENVPDAPGGDIDPMTCVHTDTDSNNACDGCGSTVNAEINFLAVNDIHGKIYDTDKHIGVDELTTYIKNLRAAYENFILISSGDMWQGSYESNLTGGLMMTDWMNEAGFDSMTLGNHEYDWSDAAIIENSLLADFPILAINIYSRETGERMSYCESSVVIDCEGFSVGIIGAIGDCYSSIATDKSENVTFKVGAELTELIKNESEKLKSDGVDVIILSIHDGYENYDVSLSNGYVDAVFEGHTHQSYVMADEYGIYHIQGGGDNVAVSNLIMSYNIITDTIGITAANVIKTSEYQELYDDPIVDELKEKYADQVAIGEKHVATIPEYMDSYDIRNLVATTYLLAGMEAWGDEYDIFLGGGYISVRDPKCFEKGDLYYKDIYSVLPFDNPITLCSVSGAKLISQFVESTNSNYFIAYSTYGSENLSSIDETGTYYIIVDTYSAYYAQNGLTVIDTYATDVYARDLLADYLEAAYPPVENDEPEAGEEDNAYYDKMITAGDALEIGAQLNPGERTDEYYYIVGTVKQITNTKYGNMYITDDLGNEIYVYGVYDEAENVYETLSKAPAVGDTVILKSQIYYYMHATDASQNKIELEHAYVIDFTVKTTVADANAIGESIGINNITADQYIMTVTITEIANDYYGNLYVTDSSGEVIYVYSTWDKSFTSRFDNFKDSISVGDTIVIKSAIKHFQNADGTYTIVELSDAIILGKID